MRAGRTAILVAMLAGLSGCAGGRVRQDLARLQAQVGMLDERMAQLERSGTAASFAVPSPEPSAADSETTMGSAASAAATASSAHRPPTRDVQQALKNAGFYQGAVDGKMGAITRNAIKEFQRVHGLNDDGVVGKLTWAKLRPYGELSSASTPGPASSGEQAAESFK